MIRYSQKGKWLGGIGVSPHILLDYFGCLLEGKLKVLLTYLSQKQYYSVAYREETQGFHASLFIYFSHRGTLYGRSVRINFGGGSFYCELKFIVPF